MGKYIASGSTNIAVNSTILHLVGSATVQPRLAALALGLLGTPGTDQAWEAKLRRSTAAGTAGSAVTPQPTGAPQGAAVTTAGQGAYSVEPTYSGFLKDIPMNPRSTFQWAAYDRDGEIACTPAAANGLGLQIIQVGGGVGSALAEMTFGE